MKLAIATIAVFIYFTSFSQKRYEDSLHAFLKHYAQTHEVVKGEDQKLLQFYPVNKTYCVKAKFKKASDNKWLEFPTSGNTTELYKVFGTLHFQLNGQSLRLNLFQSQDLMSRPEYSDYLFLPFTDATSGLETYEAGRYIDLRTKDIQNSMVLLDFNKAYNPYCAYVSGVYKCPIPPKENALPLPIKAGEKKYKKEHQSP